MVITPSMELGVIIRRSNANKCELYLSYKNYKLTSNKINV